ncbi:MAG: tryptophan 7-halogenase [Pseudomonadota bacterium]|nr:tryptophan 7-halogenase [Pseudomonadota bacterium]
MPDVSQHSPTTQRIRRIAIVGGGTSGWMAASMLARALPGTRTAITVIESPDIGIIGVGEATIPPIIDVLRFLNIDEGDFIRHTQATYKLGIKFNDWKCVGESYWHPFGTFGAPLGRRPFFHAWHKARVAGLALRFNDYSGCAALGDEFKFRYPDPNPDSPASGLRYALHFDAALVAKYLRSYAERLGVERWGRTVAGAQRRPDGFLEALQFADGSTLPADLFIDCSGFRGVLIEQVLGAGYLDWTAMLPCDRAVACPSETQGRRAPYTQSTARSAGWQWRIPLQHRTGNGYVYCSEHCSDDEAAAELLDSLGGPPLADPRFLKFTTGRRKVFWSHNCVALGLASGFLEPLESTSIHLVTSGLYHLLEHYPDVHFDQSNIDSYNSEVSHEFDRIRDFIVLHYCLTQREDTPLWRYCRSMPLPESLQQRIELYRRTGRVRWRSGELFTDVSWFYIFEGLGVRPDDYDPLLDVVTLEQLKEILASLAASTAALRRAAPLHDSYFAPRARAAGAIKAAP